MIFQSDPCDWNWNQLAFDFDYDLFIMSLLLLHYYCLRQLLYCATVPSRSDGFLNYFRYLIKITWLTSYNTKMRNPNFTSQTCLIKKLFWIFQIFLTAVAVLWNKCPRDYLSETAFQLFKCPSHYSLGSKFFKRDRYSINCIPEKPVKGIFCIC